VEGTIDHRTHSQSVRAPGSLESKPSVLEIELPEVLLLQDVADDGDSGPLPLLQADALDPRRRVDQVALRRRHHPRRPREVNGHLRHGHVQQVLARGRRRPVVAVIERVHGHPRHAGELLAERGHHGAVRRRGEHREAGPGVEDGAAAPLDVPDEARDLEELPVDGDAVDCHGVERVRPVVEQQRRRPRAGHHRGGLGVGGGRGRRQDGRIGPEGEVTGLVPRREVVDEAVGESPAEVRGGAGREGHVAVAEAEHAVGGEEAVAVVGGGAAQHDAPELGLGGAGTRQRDGCRVGAHCAARRRPVLVPAYTIPWRLVAVQACMHMARCEDLLQPIEQKLLQIAGSVACTLHVQTFPE
jgi:hypothetical protein